MVHSISHKLSKPSIARLMLASSILVAGSAQAATVSPNPLAFDPQKIGTNTTKTLTVTHENTGLTTTNIVATASGTGYDISANTCTGATLTPLTPTCTITVRFSPATTGAAFPGSVAITSTPATTPGSVTITGSSPAPVATLSPTTRNFGDQTVNSTSGAQSFTLSNGGGVNDLTGIVVAKSGTHAADFSVTPSSCANGVGCDINVTFTPAATGSRTASVDVTTTNGGNASASVTGNGVSSGAGIPILSIAPSPATLDFKNQEAGTTSAVQSIFLSNTGGATLNINSTTFGGANGSDFSKAVSSTCGTTLAAATSCRIDVTFAPPAAPGGQGSRIGTLTIATNANPTSRVIDLKGVGVSSVNFTTSAGSVKLSSDKGTPANLTQPSQPAAAPTNMTYPVGFFGFSVNVSNGATATFTFTLPSGTSANTYVKCVGSSCAPLATAQASADGKTISFSITDGGVGDADGSVNGTIVDPGAPAFNPTIVPASAATTTSDSAGALGLWTLLLMGVPALLRVRRRKLH